MCVIVAFTPKVFDSRPPSMRRATRVQELRVRFRYDMVGEVRGGSETVGGLCRLERQCARPLRGMVSRKGELARESRRSILVRRKRGTSIIPTRLHYMYHLHLVVLDQGHSAVIATWKQMGDSRLLRQFGGWPKPGTRSRRTGGRGPASRSANVRATWKPCRCCKECSGARMYVESR